MSVYTKLNEARERFHKTKLTKSGLNKFAGYKYFELGDFLIPALDIFKDVGLCSYISFSQDLATMTIVDITSGNAIAITSPMSSAALKGCHEVQNLGAVQSYLRRYLWVAALEIVEHDAVDASEGNEPKKVIIPARPKTETLGLSDSELSHIADMAEAIKEMPAGDSLDMIDKEKLTGEQLIALWNMLPSNIQSAIKREKEVRKNQKKETK